MNLDAWKSGGREFDFDGRPVFFRHDGAGPALLVIHGFPTASWDWHRLWPGITARFEAVACDMLGFGFSAKPVDYSYSILDQATLQERLCDSLGISRVSILCHDYGCSVTQELLARFIERSKDGRDGLTIDGICMLNGGLFPEAHQSTLAQKVGLSKAAPFLAKLMNESFFAKSLGEVFAPATRPTRDEMHDLWRLASYNEGTRVHPKILRYVPERTRYRQRWVGAMQEARIPLRFINGIADPVSGRAMGERYLQLIPNPDVVFLDRVGHYPQLEAPDLTWQHASDFLRNLSVVATST
ncbi:MAG: alpha/beta hydrolase [Myxococcota bacterium]